MGCETRRGRAGVPITAQPQSKEDGELCCRLRGQQKFNLVWARYCGNVACPYGRARARAERQGYETSVTPGGAPGPRIYDATLFFRRKTASPGLS